MARIKQQPVSDQGVDGSRKLCTYREGTALHLLDTDHLEVHVVSKRQDCIHHHLGEEDLATADQLGVHRGTGAPDKHFSVLTVTVPTRQAQQ